MEFQASSVATLPAAVRYDKDLAPAAKLLFAEITALTPADGYCKVPLKFFSETFAVTDRSVYNWVVQLCEKEYIERGHGSELRPTAKAYLPVVKKDVKQKEQKTTPDALQEDSTGKNIQKVEVRNPPVADETLKKISSESPELSTYVDAGVIQKGTSGLKKKPDSVESQEEDQKIPSQESVPEVPEKPKRVKSAKAVVQPIHVEYAKKFSDLFNSWIPDGSNKPRVKADGKLVYGIMKKYSATTADLDLAFGWLTERGIAINNDGNFYVEVEALSSLQTKWPKLMKEIDKVGYELPKVRTPEEIAELDRQDEEARKLHLQYMELYVAPMVKKQQAYYASEEGQQKIRNAREVLAELLK